MVPAGCLAPKAACRRVSDVTPTVMVPYYSMVCVSYNNYCPIKVLVLTIFFQISLIYIWFYLGPHNPYFFHETNIIGGYDIMILR